MNEYRLEIIKRLQTELQGLEWIELPVRVMEATNFIKLNPILEYPEYLNCELGNGLNLVLGLGDENPIMWNGVIYGYIHNENESKSYQIQINNGSPRYVIWELFDKFNELLRGAN